MNKLNIDGIQEERIKIDVFDDGSDILIKFIVTFHTLVFEY